MGSLLIILTFLGELLLLYQRGVGIKCGRICIEQFDKGGCLLSQHVPLSGDSK